MGLRSNRVDGLPLQHHEGVQHRCQFDKVSSSLAGICMPEGCADSFSLRLSHRLLFQIILGDDVQLTLKRIDSGGVEGEPCGVIMDSAQSFAAVIYPTSDKLKQVLSLLPDDKSLCTESSVARRWQAWSNGLPLLPGPLGCLSAACFLPSTQNGPAASQLDPAAFCGGSQGQQQPEIGEDRGRDK